MHPPENPLLLLLPLLMLLTEPRQGQEEAKRAPRETKRAKIPPKWSQNEPNMGQDEAKRGQEGGKMRPRWGQKGAYNKKVKKMEIEKQRHFQEMQKWPDVPRETAIFDF